MIVHDANGIVVQFADSGWEAVQWIRATPDAGWNRGHTGSNAPVQQWGSRLGTGEVDKEGAFRLVTEGWEEGVAKMHHGLHAMLNVNAPGINRWRHDVAGEQPDIYRALGGDPRAMRRRAFTKGSKPIIHIIVNTAMKAGAKDTHTMNYGIAILGLIDYLESRGKRVELDRLGVVSGDFLDGRRSMQGWKVKRADEAPDLSAIAFAIAHPASHRRVVWAMRERGHSFRSHGAPASITPQDAERIGSGGAFILDSVGNDAHRCTTPMDALRLAAERLNKAAGEELVCMGDLTVEA